MWSLRAIAVYIIVLVPNFSPSHNYCDGNVSFQMVMMI